MALGESLDSVINVRVTRAEKDSLCDAASVAGLSLSSYCRRRFLGHTVIAHTDRMMIRELRRIGGLLKKMHTESGGAYRRKTAGALSDLRKAIERLSK